MTSAPIPGSGRVSGAGRLAAFATVVGVAVFLTVSPASADPGDAAATDGLNYVALGDSYSAGFGITPSTGEPVPGCAQAEANYPHQVAAELGLQLTDVTCTGAQTANITIEPQVTLAGTAPVQLEALHEDTDVVTVTIGGNDLGFARIVESCIALSAAGPLAANDSVTGTPVPNCKQILAPEGGQDLLAAQLLSIQPAIAETFAAIKTAAPNAKVFVVGYPSIMPDAAHTPANGCFSSAFGNGQPPFPQNSFPFTDVDVPYLHSLEVNLDAAIAAQAQAASFTYLPNLEATAAHSVCAPAGDAYINGITIESLSPTPVFAVGAFHPNAAGVAFLANQLIPAIEAAFPAVTPTPTPTVTPTPTPTVTPTPTPTPTSTPTPTVTPTPTATATPASTGGKDGELAATGVSSSFVGGLGMLAVLFVLAGAGITFRRRAQSRG